MGSTTTKRNARPRSKTPSLETARTQLQHLAQALNALAQEGEANRQQLAERVRQAHTQLGNVLGELEGIEESLPELPHPTSEGYYPAVETARVLLARQIIERRVKAGLTQAQLAENAGVRVETVRRLEGGRHTTAPRTVEKIDRALTQAGG